MKEYKYVKFSEDTAKINPKMIIREYESLLEEVKLPITNFSLNSILNYMMEKKGIEFYARMNGPYAGSEIKFSKEELNEIPLILNKFISHINKLNSTIEILPLIRKEFKQFKKEFKKFLK